MPSIQDLRAELARVKSQARELLLLCQAGPFPQDVDPATWANIQRKIAELESAISAGK